MTTRQNTCRNMDVASAHRAGVFTVLLNGCPWVGGASRHWAMPAVLLAALALFMPWMEASMARHMGLELPLLFIVGWLAARVAGDRLVRLLEPWNLAGVPALTFAMLAMSVWMVPSALDFAVLSPLVAMTKVVSMLLAGVMAGASWRPAGMVIQAFFIMNWFWTTFVVGLLYKDAPQQLCSVYLADEQAHAGMAMMAWAVCGLVLWTPGVFRQFRQSGEREKIRAYPTGNMTPTCPCTRTTNI